MHMKKDVSADQRDVQKEQPYERFLELGPQALTERELLAIILRTGTREKSALELAGEVLALARYPREGLLGLYDITLDELLHIKGIGMVKAVKLKCLTELTMRISRSNAKQGLVFNSPDLVAQYFMEALRHMNTECVILVCLDTKGHMIREKKISDGSVRMSLISPREIFIEALNAKAVNIILVHNHPSGDPTPGECDRELTRNVSRLGVMMNILLLDHIIIGDNQYASFKEMGLLT